MKYRIGPIAVANRSQSANREAALLAGDDCLQLPFRRGGLTMSSESDVSCDSEIDLSQSAGNIESLSNICDKKKSFLN